MPANGPGCSSASTRTGAGAPGIAKCAGCSIEGTVGTPRYARIAAHRNVTLGLPGQGAPGLLERQSYTRTMPRLILYEWGIHLVDTLRMLLGEPRWVHAAMSRLSPHVAGEDRALLTYGFGEDGEITATIDISWSTVAGQELPTMLEEVTIEGERGTIALVPNRGDGDLIRITRLLPEERVPVDRDRPWSPVMTTALSRPRRRHRRRLPGQLRRRPRATSPTACGAGGCRRRTPATT